ncbi:hypothetical protein SALBM311S_04807 [Streptomyces alboniger]
MPANAGRRKPVPVAGLYLFGQSISSTLYFPLDFFQVSKSMVMVPLGPTG